MSNQVPVKAILTTSEPVEFTHPAQADAFHEFVQAVLGGKGALGAEQAATHVMSEYILFKNGHRKYTSRRVLDLLNEEQVSRALYNGYVVLQSPKDKLHDSYESLAMSARVIMLATLTFLEQEGMSMEDITAFLDEKGVSRHKPAPASEVVSEENVTEVDSGDTTLRTLTALRQLYETPVSSVGNSTDAINGWEIGVANTLRFVRDRKPSRTLINTFLRDHGFQLRENAKEDQQTSESV